MKLGEMKNKGKMVKETWTEGFHTAKIDHVEVKVDGNEDVKAFILKFTQNTDIYLQYFENAENYQLDSLCRMLKLNNYADLVNVKNERVSFQMIPNGEYLNPRFTTKEMSVKPAF